jgi:hypothetical protein
MSRKLGRAENRVEKQRGKTKGGEMIEKSRRKREKKNR